MADLGERTGPRPALRLIQGGLSQPDWRLEEARAELAARQAEELGMACSLRPVIRRLQLGAQATGPSAYRDVAALVYLLDRHARRWSDELDRAA